jgi:hypothetical protein
MTHPIHDLFWVARYWSEAATMAADLRKTLSRFPLKPFMYQARRASPAQIFIPEFLTSKTARMAPDTTKWSGPAVPAEEIPDPTLPLDMLLAKAEVRGYLTKMPYLMQALYALPDRELRVQEYLEPLSIVETLNPALFWELPALVDWVRMGQRVQLVTKEFLLLLLLTRWPRLTTSTLLNEDPVVTSLPVNEILGPSGAIKLGSAIFQRRVPKAHEAIFQHLYHESAAAKREGRMTVMSAAYRAIEFHKTFPPKKYQVRIPLPDNERDQKVIQHLSLLLQLSNESHFHMLKHPVAEQVIPEEPNFFCCSKCFHALLLFALRLHEMTLSKKDAATYRPLARNEMLPTEAFTNRAQVREAPAIFLLETERQLHADFWAGKLPLTKVAEYYLPGSFQPTPPSVQNADGPGWYWIRPVPKL